MTPQARVQAAIDLLDEIVHAARDNGPAADTLIARYFKTRRYAGAKDRRAVRELVYAAIRRAGERPGTGRAAMLALADADPQVAALFDGTPHAPTRISAKEPRAKPGVAPDWLARKLGEALGADQLASLLDRAPLDLRVNRLKATREDVLAMLPEAVPTPLSPDGVRMPDGARLETHQAWTDGWIEVQDEGSQLVAAGCGAEPGMRIVDLCAGAGGKTLAMAAAMRNSGVIVASDTDRGRLQQLAPRAERAGVTIVDERLLDPQREGDALVALRGSVDLVVVDAPCSGTGTWRRNPEARWRLTPARLERLTSLQARLLDLAATLVKPGGHVVHIVCSLLDEEGADQAGAFLNRHPGWRSDPLTGSAGAAHGPGRRLTPASHGTDGFFFARMAAPC
jgi:16S rRNA (cytosine967-C5)-methyltransferase